MDRWSSSISLSLLVQSKLVILLIGAESVERCRHGLKGLLQHRRHQGLGWSSRGGGGRPRWVRDFHWHSVIEHLMHLIYSGRSNRVRIQRSKAVDMGAGWRLESQVIQVENRHRTERVYPQQVLETLDVTFEVIGLGIEPPHLDGEATLERGRSHHICQLVKVSSQVDVTFRIHYEDHGYRERLEVAPVNRDVRRGSVYFGNRKLSLIQIFQQNLFTCWIHLCIVFELIG